MESWLTGKELSRRPGTVRSYRRMAEKDILPVLGKMRMQNILPSHIKQLYALMSTDGKGARTIQLLHIVFHGAFKQAVKEGQIGRSPMDAVERPRVETAEYQILTEEQARQFLMAATESPYETLFYLALTSGMRKGELLGLKWSDLDRERGIVLVQRQHQRVGWNGAFLVPPKTKAGHRQIKLGQVALAQLEVHQQRQELQRVAAGDRWQENGMIFTSSIGTYPDQTKVTREFKRLLKQAGLPDIRFHDLRQTSISILLESGAPVNTVQKRVGHSKASVTDDIYGHVMARSQDEAAQKIEEIMTPLTIDLQ